MARLSDNAQSALLMVAGMAAFTINDAILKVALDEVPLYQALFLRGIATTLVLALVARRWGASLRGLSWGDRATIALRSVAEVGAVWLFLLALMHMPLANAIAIIQSQPLVLTLAGALFLGESLGWRRLTAILIGFAGVVLIVRPGGDGFSVHSLYVLGAVACSAFRDLITRRLPRGVPSMTVILAASVASMLFGAAGSLGGAWEPVSVLAGLQLLGAAAFVMLGYVCAVLTMRRGELSFVAPFRYTSLLWALLLGLFVFGDWPDALTLLGAGIVTATGVFTLWRERQRRRAEQRMGEAPG